MTEQIKLKLVREISSEGVETYSLTNSDLRIVVDQKTCVLSENEIPVDITRDRVEMFVEAMTLNREGELGQMYYGAQCLDSNRTHIPGNTCYRYGGAGVITSVEGTRVTCSTDLVGWHGETAHTCKRGIGIYFAGNTNRRPDVVIYNYDLPAYLSAEGNMVNLRVEFDEKTKRSIIPGLTKIMNHGGSGTYNYCVSCGGSVPRGALQSYDGILTGVGSAYTNFRPGTRFIRMLFLFNWSTENDGGCPIVAFKNPRIVIHRGAHLNENGNQENGNPISESQEE